MGTKTYALRVDFDLLDELHQTEPGTYQSAKVIRQLLWDTHLAVNAGVRFFVGKLLEMRRGGGVWRQQANGIWGEWQQIRTHSEFEQVQQAATTQPETVSILPNAKLIKTLSARICENSGDERKAVALATSCAHLVELLCPPSEGRSLAPMPRDSLDLLSSEKSRALGIRPSPTHLKWRLWSLAKNCAGFAEWEAEVRRVPEFLEPPAIIAKGSRKPTAQRLSKPVRDFIKSAQVLAADQLNDEVRWKAQRDEMFNNLERPEWLRNQVVAREAKVASDHADFIRRITRSAEFRNADGTPTSDALRYLKGVALKPDAKPREWEEWQREIIDRAELETRHYRALYDERCLPLPGFAQYRSEHEIQFGSITLHDCGSEWKRAMWNLAGQKVRSHLGWVRRRSNERLLLKLRKKLFDDGGWLRQVEVKGRGNRGRSVLKPIPAGKLAVEDISFSPDCPNPTFARKSGYKSAPWFVALESYQTVEMSNRLDRVSIGAAQLPRIHSRTIKGWATVRDAWKKLRATDDTVSALTLINELNRLRTRKPRDFGDQALFEWLAEPKHHWLWDNSACDCANANDCGRDDHDCVSVFAWYNDEFGEPLTSITLTENHATRHPVWPFFGENSAVGYRLERRATMNSNGKTTVRLFLVFVQLLRRLPESANFEAANEIAIPLRGHGDFERSFPQMCEPTTGSTSPTEKIQFTDDLLNGAQYSGSSLGGIKVVWDRSALPVMNQDPPRDAPPARVFVSFSCSVEMSDEQSRIRDESAAWLRDDLTFIGNKKSAKDGLTNLLYLHDAVQRENAKREGNLFAPGSRAWPRAAISSRFSVTGFDQGTRRGVVGVTWRITDSPDPERRPTWLVGVCGTTKVFAEQIRISPVSLPGDDEDLPTVEQKLRDRVFDIRRRLNLNNALLRAARLLTADTFDLHFLKTSAETDLSLKTALPSCCGC